MATTRAIGYKGKILKGSTNILGMAEWGYSGESRKLEPSQLFNYQYELQTPTTMEGGEITVSGDYIAGDPGIALIEEAFNLGSELVDLKLYIDDVNYFIPDPNTELYDGTSQPSYITITKSPTAVKQGASGIARVEFTAKVSGKLVLQGADASTLICETIAACNADGGNSNVTIIGRVGGFDDIPGASNLHLIAQAGKSINGLVTLGISEVVTASGLIAGPQNKAAVFALTSDVGEGYGTYYFRAGVKRADKTGDPIVYGGISTFYLK